MITLLDADLGEQFAAAALELVSTSGLAPDEVDLIGCHGQTIWHAVREDGSVAGTLQIGRSAVVAEQTASPPSATCAQGTWQPAARVRPSWRT